MDMYKILAILACCIVIIIVIVILTKPTVERAIRLAKPSANRVVYWNRKKLEDIEHKKTPPPVAAKELAHFHRALLDAVRQGHDIDKVAISQMNKSIAEKYVTWSTPAQYTKTGEWVPALPDYKGPLLSDWGESMRFGTRPEQATTPPDMASDAYMRDYEETKALGRKDSTVRTQDQTDSAHFWALGPGTVTPPGIWNIIAGDMPYKSTEHAAQVFSMLNTALSDAGVAAWGVKYKYNIWRPVTAITTTDPDWRPLIDTPPFPSCVSGHSAFSAAAGEVLEHAFGERSICVEYQGRKRCWASWKDAVMDAGRSRIYGGIHWEFDNADGIKLGKSVAREFIENDEMKQYT